MIASNAACAPLFDRHGTNAGAGRGIASSAAAGVHVTTNRNEWRGWTLVPALVPLPITIDNDSSRPLRIRYREIWLATAGGARAAALPAIDLAGKGPPVPRRYPYVWSGFYLAPHLIRFYRGFWTGRWTIDDDAEHYEMRFRELTTLMSPTTEMVHRALPEGVLEPAGYITGVLYFRKPAGTATLVVDLVDAASAERFGTVEVAGAITQ
jgi:hypothetical protein